MKLIEKLRQDHKGILAEMDGIEALLDRLDAETLPRFIGRVWGLVSDIEKHEEYEEMHLLVPLDTGAPDLSTMRDVDRVRREHGDIFDRLTALQDRLTLLRRLPAELWTDAVKAEVRAMTHLAFNGLREHIRRENLEVLFLVPEASPEEVPSA
jgi:hypothetical protein